MHVFATMGCGCMWSASYLNKWHSCSPEEVGQGHVIRVRMQLPRRKMTGISWIVSLATPSLKGRGSGDTAIVDLCSLANFSRHDE